MTDDIATAFAHPEDRARARDVGDPPDRISLRDHVASADIGAFHEERGQAQRLRFNVVVELAPREADAGDDVDRILSYDLLIDSIAAELEAERLNLLETLADRIAARILAAPQAARVFLRIEKLDRAPGALGVEIVRSRAEVAGAAGATIQAARPVVLYLEDPALPGAALAAILDRVASEGAPVLIATGAPALPLPGAAGADAARRIALLALDQAAWALASRDGRLGVAATRTEIGWALSRCGSVVWAPSKMMLDAADAPDGGPGSVLLWLAGQFGGRKLLLHGNVAVPAESRIPVARI